MVLIFILRLRFSKGKSVAAIKIPTDIGLGILYFPINRK